MISLPSSLRTAQLATAIVVTLAVPFGTSTALAAAPATVTTAASTGGVSVAEPAPSTLAVANTPSGCASLAACQWDSTGYAGDLSVITGTGRYDNFGNIGGSACGSWYHCQLSTYDSHTTCQVWWYTSTSEQGSRLINTKQSGSSNLYSTYEGDFAYDLASLINYYC
jgi:hypothetical protein